VENAQNSSENVEGLVEASSEVGHASYIREILRPDLQCVEMETAANDGEPKDPNGSDPQCPTCERRVG